MDTEHGTEIIDVYNYIIAQYSYIEEMFEYSKMFFYVYKL